MASDYRPFLKRAEAFLRSLVHLSDPELFVDESERTPHAPSVALLSVHASISFSDAIHELLTGTRPSADNHQAATRSLRRACGRHGRSADGVKHLAWLLKRKNRFAYEDRYARLREAEDARVRAERFASWAYSEFPEFGGDS